MILLCLAGASLVFTAPRPAPASAENEVRIDSVEIATQYLTVHSETHANRTYIFATTETQYYLRTAAEGFEYGDSVMISGGPGLYLMNYVGPQIGANIGADLPLDTRNRGLQVVPTYRLHATITWSF